MLFRDIHFIWNWYVTETGEEVEIIYFCNFILYRPVRYYASQIRGNKQSIFKCCVSGWHSHISLAWRVCGVEMRNRDIAQFHCYYWVMLYVEILWNAALYNVYIFNNFICNDIITLYENLY